ncbi:hypothetical protein PRNP1_006603 [Phytophthora ramorum]
MARSKEQWKAQQKRAMHTQSQSNSFFQVKRPSPHPSASSALFQLGKPAPAALLKPDPIQIPRQSGSSSSQVIDLTLDDEEEEDEPMGAQVTQQPAAPAGADAVSAAAFDALQLRMLDGTENEASAVAQSLQTDSISEMLVPLAEDVESDVDEEWPKVPPVETPSVTSVVTASVPLSVNKQPSHGQTTEEVGVALDAIRRTIPFSQGGQQRNDAEKTDQVEVNDQHTHTLSYDDDDNKMEADVDEELPIQASTTVGDASGSKTADRVVRVENLEDGEIFEEGAAPKASVQVQRVIMREHHPDQFDALPVDAMGIRPHLRNKKQKKRGKKKTKRKLEAMQLMHGSPGEMPTEFEFERVIRQRPFVDTPPPGQYTLAMVRNGPTRANEEKSVETPEQNDRAKPSGGDEGDKVTCDPQAAPGDSSVPRNLPATAQAKAFGDMIEGAVNDGSSCETDKSTATSEQNEVGDKMDPPSASTLESPKPSAKVIATTPEFRPLTACSQSLVIRLNPEDFSPRKVGNDTHAVSSKATASSSVQEAIKKLRLEIAEREKTKTNRLLENAAAKLSKQSSGTGASSAASSSSSPDQLSPERDIRAISAQPPDATASSPKVYATDICTGEGRLSGRVAGEAEGKGSTDGVYTSAEVTERNVAEALPPEARTPAETVTGQEASSAPVESLREPVLEPQEQSDTSGGISEDVPATRSCLTTEQTASRDASKPASRKSELDFDAIRAEYEQCVTECEEADMHIAQLSDEMAQLQKLSVGSTASGS